MDFTKILQEAHDAATQAIRDYFNGHEEQPLNCGFAWVTIDGTSALARHCRKQLAEATGSLAERNKVRLLCGDKGYPSGWEFWGPGNWPSEEEVGRTVYAQDMTFRRVGAEAFQKKLAEHGISATVGTRLD